jgi:hypothetical protein
MTTSYVGTFFNKIKFTLLFFKIFTIRLYPKFKAFIFDYLN